MPLCDRFFKPLIREKSAGMGGKSQLQFTGKKKSAIMADFVFEIVAVFWGRKWVLGKKVNPQNLAYSNNRG